jgi:signal transduction histidine kinase
LRVAANQAVIGLEQAQLLVDLQRANQQKDEFLSVAAHELRTPVTSMRGFVQVLLRQLDKHGEVNFARLQKALKTIDDQSVKLTHLISQLLDLSRIEAGRLILEQELVDIAHLVSRVAAMMQNNTKQHTISAQIIPTVSTFADPIRLEQVLINLLDNAIKYSPDGGAITVNMDVIDNQTIKIAVIDRGLGIPPERRQNIFERFYQAHADGYHGGMGLGLYITRQIVELHGGNIYAEFPADGGTRFVVVLPMQIEAQVYEQ